MSFVVGSHAMIRVSGEIGLVAAKCYYLGGRTMYLLRYCNNVGVAVEQWWEEDALSHLPREEASEGSGD